MDVESAKDLNVSEDKMYTRKNMILMFYGAVVVIVSIFGTIWTVDYVLKLFQPLEVPPQMGPSFMMLRRKGDWSILYLSKYDEDEEAYGYEKEIYRDKAVLLYPTFSDQGRRFAFCKRDENGVTGVYIRTFGSSEAPVKIEGVSPLDCLFSVEQDSNTLVYVSKTPGQHSNEIYRLDMNEEVPKPVKVLSRFAFIASIPILGMESKYLHIEAENDDDDPMNNTTRYKLVSSQDNITERGLDLGKPFELVASKTSSKIVSYEKDSKEFIVFKPGYPRNYSKVIRISDDYTYTIKKIMFSSTGSSIYCLLCNDEVNLTERFKVIEWELNDEIFRGNNPIEIVPDVNSDVIESLVAVDDIVYNI